jgi:hypothetical protein
MPAPRMQARNPPPSADTKVILPLFLKRDKFLVMRRKYRPHVALGIGLYLLTMGSAFR